MDLGRACRKLAAEFYRLSRKRRLSLPDSPPGTQKAGPSSMEPATSSRLAPLAGPNCCSSAKRLGRLMGALLADSPKLFGAKTLKPFQPAPPVRSSAARKVTATQLDRRRPIRSPRHSSRIFRTTLPVVPLSSRRAVEAFDEEADPMQVAVF
jgi:hypothetical protein